MPSLRSKAFFWIRVSLWDSLLLACAILLAVGLVGCGGSDSGEPSQPPSITRLGASSAILTSGTSTTLTAVFQGGSGSIDQGIGPVTSGQPVVTPRLQADTTYTLTVRGSIGSVTASTWVAVVPPPGITAFSAEAPTVTAGQGTTLTALFSGGTGTIDPGLGEVVSGSPIPTGDLSTATDYTLTVTNAAGTKATRHLQVAVADAPSITDFCAAAPVLTADTGTALTAVFSGGTGFIDMGIGLVVSGVPIPTGNLAASTNFTLTVTNAAGATATRELQVPVVAAPVITSFAAAKDLVTQGRSTTLSAVFSGGEGRVDQGVGSVTSGDAVPTGGLSDVTRFTLTVTNAAGMSVTRQASVGVVPPPVITSFTAANDDVTFHGDEGTTLTAVFAQGTATINHDLGAVRSGVGIPTGPMRAPALYRLTVTNAAGDSVTAGLPVYGPSRVATEITHALAVDSEGAVWTWGGNESAQSGAVDARNLLPVILPFPQPAVSVAAGTYHYNALLADGTVWSWDTTSLGGGLDRPITLPSLVAGLPKAKAIAMGSTHSLALAEDGTVWAWGGNWCGALGDGTRKDRDVPAQVPGLTDVVAIAAGDAGSAAVKKDGSFWVWGRAYSSFDTLFTTPPVYLPQPTQVPGISQAAFPSLGTDPACVVCTDGTLWQAAPDHGVQITGLPGVTALVEGERHSAALAEDGSVWTWGFQNLYGELGTPAELLGYRTTPTAPVQVVSLSGIVALAAGGNHTLALAGDGSILAWGDNRYGTLAAGGGPVRTVPTASAVGIWSKVTGFSDHTYFLMADGTVQSCGYGGNMALGWSDGLTRSLPSPIPNLPVQQDVDAFGDGCLLLGKDGRLTLENRFMTVSLNDPGDVVAFANGLDHALLLRKDGTVWGFGENANGQLGDGTTTDSNQPAQVLGLTNVTAVAAGLDISFALKSDGTVWAWGRNFVGGLGDPAAPDTVHPIQVQGLQGIVALSVDQYNYIALKNDGTVWTWGLADGSVHAPPVQLPGLSSVTAIAAGWESGMALCADGTVWTWGNGCYGQLGNGLLGSSQLPARVEGLAGVEAIGAYGYAMFARTGDRTLVWGGDWDGQLGLGRLIYSSTPLKIPAVRP